MMSPSNQKEGNSLRLRCLQSFHSNERVVWDIGCDHGKVGLSFKENHHIEAINLVDPAEDVINGLTLKLKDAYITNPSIKIIKNKGQNLIISTSNNIIFIAGMGGKEISEIVKALLPQLDSSSTFIISPHRKILELRSCLKDMEITLLDEKVIFENDQYYLILALRPGLQGEKVSPYGDKLWRDKTGQDYRIQQMKAFSNHKDVASERYLEFLASINP